MKRTFKLFLLVAIIATSTTLVNAQKSKKPFSGTIKSTLTYEGYEATQTTQLPTSSTTIISGNKQKTTVDYGQYAIVSIMDGDEESTLFYIDVMGQKIGFSQNKAAIAKEKEEDKSPKPTITKSDETKEIAGVKCKKITILTKDEETGDESTTVIWYTEELGTNEKLNFMSSEQGINGIVLGTETTSGKTVTKSFATEIVKEKIKSLEFLVPADAKIFDTKEKFNEELKAKFGGGEEE